MGRQEKRLRLSNNAERELRAQIVQQQDSSNTNFRHILEKDKQFIDEQLMLSENESANVSDLKQIKYRISSLEQHYQSELQRERSMHRKFNEQSQRVKQTLVDEINKMELQHQSKLNNLEIQIVDLKNKNRALQRIKEMEMNELSQKLTSEIDKERNIATIMVEDLDEEKTRLMQEMNHVKEEYEKKL